MIKNIIILLSLFSFTTNSLAAPFGISQGQSIKNLKILRKTNTKHYEVIAPIPNSNFEYYAVIATPFHGVCAVMAYTKAYSTFDEAKNKRNHIEKILSKYGKPVHVKPDDSYETLSARAPIDVYDLEWRKVPPPLSTISLDVFGSGSGQTVRLTYFYRNMVRCRNWEPNQDSRGL